jgi:hypothetical protein
MHERIDRHDDEGLYQPKIHSRWIRELHAISQETGVPITVLLDRALKEFTVSYRTLQGEKPAQPSPRDGHETVIYADDAGSDGRNCSPQRPEERRADDAGPVGDGDGDPVCPELQEDAHA